MFANSNFRRQATQGAALRNPSGGGVSAGATSDQVNQETAALMREQYADYVDRFRPLEIQAINENLDDSVITEKVAEAKAGANKAWDASRGVSDRALSDYGVQLTADQQRTRNRLHKQSRSASVADTGNSVRVMETDRRFQRGDDLFQSGRLVEGTASNQYGAAAQLESVRNRAYDQAKAAANASRRNTYASLAGTAASAYFAYLAFLSDEKTKHKIKDVSDEQALKDVKAIDVKSYNYKPETGMDQERRVGGMRDDMPDYVQREDGMVDVQNSIGMLTSAVKALDKKVSAIQGGK